MPRANFKIVVGSRVSATMRYLRSTAFASATLPVDINAPGIRFEGNVTGMYKDGAIDYCNVTFDVLPDVSITLRETRLRYRDTAPRRMLCFEQYYSRSPHRRRQVRQQQQQFIVTDEYPDLLDDAIQTASPMESDNESNDETVDLNWEESSISIDQRLARPDPSNQYINPSLLGLSGAGATPAQFFLHFLPCDHIQSVVIPAINYHARQLYASWIGLDWLEYLTWIMLLVIMTVVNCHDKRMYWGKSNSPFHLNVDFTEFMEMSRFNDISKLHVFVVPNGELANTDPLYQPLSFLKAFNYRMEETWHAQLKKVPRKPHPIGQEYKTIADNVTCIIMRMDFCGDPLQRRPRPTEDRSIAATVKQLTEPWYHSGRVIIADSWFGSPKMARKRLEVGLHSIMQVCKRLYWPKGMPTTDIVQSLGPEYSSSLFMKLTVPGEHLFVGAFRDLKKGYQRRKKELMIELYLYISSITTETNKSSVDTSNNRRDNLINFHDVMRTYRWELRCLSFFLGVTEANAFSAFKFFSVGGNDVGHTEFRWRLAESLKCHIKDLQENAGYAQIRTISRDPRTNGHSLVSMGTNSQGN
ncbi:hypothetical protein INT47_003059 [Mucor saturninus]|uniref:PiggyBac transposable element-derived protein domain-containing protein n=1 Tax=Mucor saturninus TaxID=64648 RepID=A0A8H7QM74_9FUNG|nr:hypothetical protein INT47_003059 [Mucor saturninus]